MVFINIKNLMSFYVCRFLYDLNVYSLTHIELCTGSVYRPICMCVSCERCEWPK